MKQTAVEWLLDRIEDVDNTPEIWEQIKTQAKEMERQQIIKAFKEGQIDIAELLIKDYNERFATKHKVPNNDNEDAEQYFKETYGGEK